MLRISLRFRQRFDATRLRTCHESGASSSIGLRSSNWPQTYFRKRMSICIGVSATNAARPKSVSNPSRPPRPLMFSYSACVIGLVINWRLPRLAHFSWSTKTFRQGRLTPSASVVVAQMTRISPLRNASSMMRRWSQSRSAL